MTVINKTSNVHLGLMFFLIKAGDRVHIPYRVARVKILLLYPGLLQMNLSQMKYPFQLVTVLGQKTWKL